MPPRYCGTACLPINDSKRAQRVSWDRDFPKHIAQDLAIWPAVLGK